MYQIKLMYIYYLIDCYVKGADKVIDKSRLTGVIVVLTQNHSTMLYKRIL